MNCSVCGAPLPGGTRFCPNCGAVADRPAPGSPPVPSSEPTGPTDNTVRVQPQPGGPPLWGQPGQVPPYGSQARPPMSPLQAPAPLPYYQSNAANNRGANMPLMANDKQGTRPKRKRNWAGCAISSLTVLVILLLVIGVGWVFVLRPYLHNMVTTQMDNALSAGVQQIPETLPALPIGNIPIPIMENTINNLIVLNLAPNNPIKNPTTQITPDGITISFQIYGFSNGISLKPTLQNGNLVATNVGISGPISLIMSPDELTPLLNRHLIDAQQRLKHPIQDVQLKDHEIDLVLGGATTP